MQSKALPQNDTQGRKASEAFLTETSKQRVRVLPDTMLTREIGGSCWAIWQEVCGTFKGTTAPIQVGSSASVLDLERTLRLAASVVDSTSERGQSEKHSELPTSTALEERNHDRRRDED